MGYDTSNYFNDWFVCPWTGEKFVNRDQALQLSPNCEGALNSGNKSVLTGEASEQKGSQFWMDANPAGVIINEPSDEVKRLVNNAEYAAGWLGTYANTIPANVQVSAAVSQIQRFPVSVGTAEIWKVVPQLSPQPDTLYNSPQSRPGGEAEPAYTRTLTADAVINSGESVGEQSTAGVGSTGVGAVSTITNMVKSYGMWILGAIIMIVLLGFLMTSKIGSRVSS